MGSEWTLPRQKMGAGIARALAALRRTGVALALALGCAVTSAAATVTLDLTWTVTNTPTIPASHYRVEESVAGVWGTVIVVPATQLNLRITGRAPGLYTFRVWPVKDGIDGVVSNNTICGATAPDTTVSLSCTPTVVP